MKTTSHRNSWLLLLFNNTGFANIGDATGIVPSTSSGSLYISLHTADPGAAGSQTTSEATYTSYARVAVARSGSGWTVSGNSVSNAAQISFPACTGGSNVITHAGIGTASSGTGVLLYRVPIGRPMVEFTAKASDNTINIQGGHSLAVSDRVSFYSTPNSTFPTGITEGTLYYVKTVSTNTFTLSTTDGGAELDITGDGSGFQCEGTPFTVSSAVTPIFAAGQLVVKEF